MSQWSTSTNRIFPDFETVKGPLIVALLCRIGDSKEIDEYALFDTAARWSIFPGGITESYSQYLEPTGIKIKMNTRHGDFSGELQRVDIFLVADTGEDLIVEATVATLPEWQGPIVIGFQGFLERIRWACDPVHDNVGRLFFGPITE